LGACLALSALAASPAQAYPQWQFTSGAVRCNQCHYSPAGGGLLTGYGRDYLADEFSTFEGDGAFLHGAVELPAWLDLGGDFRVAALMKDVGGDIDNPKQAVFPMQAELAGRVAFGEAISLQATVGYRGQVRTTDAEIPTGSPEPGAASRFISREHFLMWRPSAQGWYVRAGRFFTPFGLRFAEHIAYVRRDLGFNLYQETYNVSAGYVVNAWELHLTAFGPDFVQKGIRESGGAALLEKRLFDETAQIGAQARVAFGDNVTRVTGGLVGKYYLEPANLLFLAEANVVHLRLDRGDPLNQFVGAFGLSFVGIRSVLLTALVERNHADVTVKNVNWNAGMGIISWFPYPHFELQLVGRVDLPGGGDQARLGLLQLHYYL
jgi:hypothetical protein